MTRVNVGIDPSELCDQMLLAEIRELPRVFKFRDSAGPKDFTLGTGHVLWCARHHHSLLDRLYLLCKEATRRGAKLQSYPTIKCKNEGEWGEEQIAIARPILLERLTNRLNAMKRKPTWGGHYK